MQKSIGVGSFHEGGGMEVELQAIREETSAEIANGSSLRTSTTAAAIHTLEKNDGTNTSSSSETMEKLRGPLVPKESADNALAESIEEGGGQPQTTPMAAMEIAGPSNSLNRPSQNKGILLWLDGLDSFLIDWAYTVLIGFFVVSYWRVSSFFSHVALLSTQSNSGHVSCR